MAKWSENEVYILKENYNKKSVSEISNMLSGRSETSVYSKAHSLGLTNHYGEEDCDLGLKTCSKCKNKFPRTREYFEIRKSSKDGFRSQCRECRGFKLKEDNYTEYEINILKKYYSTMETRELIDKFGINKNVNAVCSYATKYLGLKKEYWSIEEIDILKKYYNEMPTKELMEKYSLSKSENSIVAYATKKLGLKKKVKINHQYILEFIKSNGCELITEEYINNKQKLEIRCGCGDVFITTWNEFFNGNKRTCNLCTCSKGELRISNLLKDNNIEYEWQKRFDGLLGVNGGELSYDFYLPKYNLLIEYQGEFHDGTARLQTDEEYKIQKEHDIRKKKYSEENGFNMLEIWYFNYDNIESIIEKELKICFNN